jgi:c-di-GMP-binding flagellar brake protein YcgR
MGAVEQIRRVAPMEERRSSTRYKLPLRLSIKHPQAPQKGGTFLGQTRDFSTGGVYFSSQERWAVGDKFEFSATLPVPGTPPTEVLVEAQARVVRLEQIEEGGSRSTGVAAVIESYEIIRPKIAPS